MSYDDNELNTARDIPLSFRFEIQNSDLIRDRLQAIGYPRAKNLAWETVRLSIFAEAVSAYSTGRWISYSRNRNYYSQLGRYFGVAYNYDRVINSIDQAAGFRKYPLLESHKASCYSDQQSVFRATPKLVELFKSVDFDFQFLDVIRLRAEPPVVRGKLKAKWKKGKGWIKPKKRSRLIDYADTPETVRMRGEVERINAHLKNVELRHPAVAGLDITDRKRLGRYVLFDDRCVLVTQLRIYRSFCRGSFDLGGRAYGWWQQLSKETRAKILLNGEEVVEPDFSQFHATMLYALRGLPVPQDAYQVSGWPRETIKLAFNVIINARTTQAAIGAVQKELKKAKLQADRSTAAGIVRAVKAAHPKIKSDFGSDRGVALMRKDSDIIIRVMLALVAEHIPFLPVHDSIVCRRTDKQRVMQLMSDSFSQEFPDYSCKVKV